MNKSVLVVGGVVVCGLGFYFYKMRASTGQPATGIMSTPGAGQPSQINGIVAPQPQRVDNANQPWYGGATGFIAQAASGLQTSLTTGLGSLWSGLSGSAGTDSSGQTSPDANSLNS